MTISLEQVEREIKRINLEITRLQGESRQVRDRTNYLAGGSGNFVPGGGGATPLPSHNIIGVKHFGVGSALDVIGFSASNTLGVLSPSSSPGAAASLLKTDASGFLTLTGLTLNGNLTVTGTVDGVDVSAHVADADAHHSQAHVLATTSALGPDHTVSGLTLGQVLRATGATTAAFGSLIEGDLPVHDIISKHSASGLTIGHVIRASGATTFLFAQLQHSDLGGVGADDHHAQVHSITGADHTIVASTFQLVGATATNTLGLITPSSDPVISEAILKTNPAGRVTLQDISINSGGKVSLTGSTTNFFKPGVQIADSRDFVIALDVGNAFSTGVALTIGHNDFLPGDPNWDYLLTIGESGHFAYRDLQIRNGFDVIMQSGAGSGETGRWDGATGDISIDAAADIAVGGFTLRHVIAQMLALPGLRGFWPMSSFDNGGDAYDLSGQGRKLTYNGNPTYNYDGLAPYIALDGTGDYLSRPDEAALDILGTETYVANPGLTIGGWFYHANLTATQSQIGKFHGTGNQRSYRLVTVATTGDELLQVSTNGSTVVSVTASAAISAGGWYFIVGRFTPSVELAVFVNGTKTTNASGIPASLFNSTEALQIGNSASNIMTGRASMCFLCSSALSDNIINNLFQQSRILFGV